MAVLSRDDILEADDLDTRTVEVPEWGGEVIVRTLTAEERDRFELGFLQGEMDEVEMDGETRRANLVNARARLCALCIVDEGGDRLFSNDEVQVLGAKSGAALDRVYQVAQKLNGITDEDIEELEGN